MDSDRPINKLVGKTFVCVEDGCLFYFQGKSKKQHDFKKGDKFLIKKIRIRGDGYDCDILAVKDNLTIKIPYITLETIVDEFVNEEAFKEVPLDTLKILKETLSI